MLTIKVIEDLDLSKYDPEELVTARLQRPFLLDDDEEAENFNVQRQRQAEQDLRSRLTSEQQERRSEYIKSRARAELGQYKKLVDNMGDPVEMQAKITEALSHNPLRESTETMFGKQKSSLDDFQVPRASVFTDEQLKELGAMPTVPKPSRKSHKTQKQLDSLIKIQTDHGEALKVNAKVHERNTELMNDQLTELRTANTTLRGQVQGSTRWNVTMFTVALLGVAVAVIVPIVLHNTQSPSETNPTPTVEQETEAP